jgi:hypothetical protein
VDHVSQGRSLVETIGRTGAYDYILASNLVEHTVDLIGFLNDCEALLKPNGRLSLIVPDLRYCFDLLRPFTTVGEVVDAHLYPRRFHSPGSLLDHMVYACKRGEAIAWAKTEAAPVELQFADMGSAKELIQKGLDQAEYVDTHRWKFTPSSFSLLIQDLRELEYHKLVEVAGAPTMGFEFFATLGRPGPQSPYRDRLELLQMIRGEIAAVAQQDGLIRSDATIQDAPYRATEESARLRLSAAELQSATLAIRGERDALLASRSWKITAPLRALGRVLRRH